MRKNEMDAAQKALAEAVAEGIRAGKEPEMSQEEKAVLREAARADKEKEKNVIYTSYLETEKSIVEEIYPITKRNADGADGAYHATKTQFIVYDKLTASIDYLDTLLYRGKEYRPIEDDLLRKKVVLLPSGIEEFGTTGELAKSIYEFLFKYFQVPIFYEKFLPYMVLFYWVYERFPFVPYIHFVGLTGTGKTTAQEVFGSICYKPIDASGAITMSPVFRVADTWRGTLLLDEFNAEGEGYSEMIGLLKGGVGNKAILRTEGDRKREVMAYLLKSPKVFTSEGAINDAGLRSRIFVVQMEKNKRKVPLYRLGRFEEEAQVLRNKLLLWRLRHLSKINLDDIEYGYPELSGFDGRVQQVITPIYFLSDDITRTTILDFAKIQEEETKRERLDSLEGQIFQIIASSQPIDIALTFIAAEINKDKARRAISEKRIAGIVRKILQFDIESVGHDKQRMVMASKNEERVEDLKLYFGLSTAESSASSAASAGGNSEHIDAPENADDLSECPEKEII